MDRDKISERIKQLEGERDQVRANLIAYEGALQDCNYWLEQCSQKETNE